MKTETIQEFLARGGKITFGPTKEAKGSVKKLSSKPIKDKKEEDKVNMDFVPAGLRISLGIKD